MAVKCFCFRYKVRHSLGTGRPFQRKNILSFRLMSPPSLLSGILFPLILTALTASNLNFCFPSPGKLPKYWWLVCLFTVATSCFLASQPLVFYKNGKLSQQKSGILDLHLSSMSFLFLRCWSHKSWLQWRFHCSFRQFVCVCTCVHVCAALCWIFSCCQWDVLLHNSLKQRHSYLDIILGISTFHMKIQTFFTWKITS